MSSTQLPFNADAGISTAGNVIGSAISANTISATTFNGNLSSTGNVIVGGQVSAVGNIYAPNFIGNVQGNLATTNISISGNVQAGNVYVATELSSAGNVTAPLFTGSVVGNVTGNIAGNVTGNITGNLSGTTVTATGNISSGNVLTAGLVSATGNITVGNVLTDGLVSATGNATAGNILTAGVVSATGNIITGNLRTAGLITATGNITVGNVLTDGVVSVGGNVTADNILTDGVVSAAGNVNGDNIIAIGLVSASSFVGNVYSVEISASGNITGGNLITDGDIAGRGMLISGGDIEITELTGVGGSLQVQNDIQANNITANTSISTAGIVQSGTISASGNVRGGNILTSGNVSVEGTTWGNNFISTGEVSVQGNITSNSYVFGNGVFLSGLTPYSNAAVAAYLPVYPGNLNAIDNITATGNISANLITGTILTNTQPYITNLTELTVTGNIVAAGVLSLTADTISVPTGSLTFSAPANIILASNVTISGTGTALEVQNLHATGPVAYVSYDAGSPSQANLSGLRVSTNDYASLLWNSDTNTWEASTNVNVAGNLTSVDVSATANITGSYIVGNGAYLTGLPAGYSNVNAAAFIESYSGNVGNITATGNLVAIGDITSNNLTTNSVAVNGTVSASGNVNSSALYIDGNAVITGNANVQGNLTYNNITNLTTSNLVLGLGNNQTGVDVNGGGIAVGNTNEATLLYNFASTSWTSNINFSVVGNVLASESVSATGNVQGGNVTTAGLVSATGNVQGGNVTTAGLVSATGNVRGANFNTAGQVVATANITGGNILTAGQISATGNISGDYFTVANDINVTGNVYSNNLITTTDVDATGNITADNFFGNGSQLTGVVATGIGTLTALTVTGNTRSGNLLTGGYVSATGNVTANGFVGVGAGLTLLTGANVTGFVANATFANTTETANTANTATYVTANAQTSITSLGALTGLSTTGDVLVTGDVSATGNITADYFIGDGSQLSGLPAGYSNVYAVAYGEAGWAGNIVPNANVTYSLGNSTRQWKDLWISNNTIYINSVPITLTSGNVLQVDGDNVITASSTQPLSTTGNVTGANILTAGEVSATGNVFGNYIVGNGYLLTSINAANLVGAYGNANVADYLPTYTGELTAGNISTAGNITASNVTANYFIGNGYLLTSINAANLVGAYGNANVAEYLPTYTGNVTAGNISVTGDVTGNVAFFNDVNINNLSTNAILYTNSARNVTNTDFSYDLANNTMLGGNVSLTGNVTANYFIGDGSQLTGMYGNTNVADYLPTYTGELTAGNISTAGNVTANYFVGVELSVTGNVTSGNVTTGIVSATGDVYGNNFSTVGTLIVASTTGNSVSTAGNVAIGELTVARDATILGNLSVTGNVTFTSSNIIITDDLYISLANNQSTSGGINGAGIVAGNTGSQGVATFVYSSTNEGWTSNVSIVPAGNATANLGTSSDIWNIVYANTASVTGDVLGGNVLTAGLVSATANVTGGNVLTAGLVSATSNVTGGNVLTAGLVSATGNVFGNYIVGNGYLLSSLNAANLVGAYGNANVAEYLPTYTGELTAGNVSVSGNVTVANIITSGSSGNITGANVITANTISASGNLYGTVDTAAQPGITSLGTLTVLTVTGNVTGNYFVGNGSTLTGLVSVSGTAATITENAQPNITSVGTLTSLTVTGNTQSGNLLTAGEVSATGNVTGNFFVGNGSVLTGLVSVSGTAATVTTNAQPNITSVGTLTTVTVTGNTQSGNLLTAGEVSATGNVTGNFFVGNGSVLTGLVSVSGTAATVTTNAQPNITSVGTLTTVTVTGNTQSGNLLTAGEVSATGNVTGNFFVGNGSVLTGLVSVSGTAATVTTNAQPNITSVGNLTTVTVTGNTQSGNLLTAGYVSATGNVTGDYINGNGAFLTGLPEQYGNSNAASYFASGNSSSNISITGNILTTSYVSAAGNITGNFFIGDGSLLTNVAAITANTVLDNAQPNITSVGNLTTLTVSGNVTANYFIGDGSGLTDITSITNGTSNVDIATANGNITMAVANVRSFSLRSNAISIGANAGNSGQGANTVAIGNSAGQNTQGADSIAIGWQAGQSAQGTRAVAVGMFAGQVNQPAYGVAVGYSAGQNGQGSSAIAIGAFAGTTDQANNSIILNATGSVLTAATANATYIAPIRADSSANTIGSILTYNPTSFEVTYANTISVTGNITGSYLFGNGSQLTGVNSPLSGNLAGNLLANGFFVNNLTQLSVNGNIQGNGIISTTGNVTGNNFSGTTFTGNAAGGGATANAVGYIGMPVNGQSSTYTLALSDQGKMIYASGTSPTITIPLNATVAFPVGTTMSLAQYSSGTMTISPTSGVTLVYAGTSFLGNRTVGTNGIASLTQVNTNIWFITGTGIS